MSAYLCFHIKKMVSPPDNLAVLKFLPLHKGKELQKLFFGCVLKVVSKILVLILYKSLQITVVPSKVQNPGSKQNSPVLEYSLQNPPLILYKSLQITDLCVIVIFITV